MPIQVQWSKCQGDEWCSFSSIDLDQPSFDNLEGVYVIWHGGSNPATVRVGQGDIRERLKAHRLDPQIIALTQYGLYVTWAAVDPEARDGVEAYLTDMLVPLFGAHFATRTPIEVNLPW